jgi:hypothetical protein
MHTLHSLSFYYKILTIPRPQGYYSKVKALHASRTYGNSFQEASGGISCTGTCISPKLPPQRVIARHTNHTSHKSHTVVLIPSDATGFYCAVIIRCQSHHCAADWSWSWRSYMYSCTVLQYCSIRTIPYMYCMSLPAQQVHIV